MTEQECKDANKLFKKALDEGKISKGRTVTMEIDDVTGKVKHIYPFDINAIITPEAIQQVKEENENNKEKYKLFFNQQTNE